MAPTILRGKSRESIPRHEIEGAIAEVELGVKIVRLRDLKLGLEKLENVFVRLDVEKLFDDQLKERGERNCDHNFQREFDKAKQGAVFCPF